MIEPIIPTTDTFADCDLSQADLSHNVFRDCRFTHCDLSLATFHETSFDRVTFEDCRLTGINWTAMAWRKPTGRKRSSFPIKFRRCSLNYSVFVGLSMYKARFEDCVLKETAFEDADLEESSFTNSDLEGATFQQTNLQKADFSTARNYTINVCANRTRGAKFSLPEALSLLYALDIDLTAM